MAKNLNLKTSTFAGIAGVLRIVTLIVGVVNLGMIAAQYDKISKEEFFLAVVILTFFISLILAIILVLGVLSNADLIKNVDSFYHVIAGMMLFISGVTFLVSVFDRGDFCNIDNLITGYLVYPKYGRHHCSDSVYPVRIVAGFLGVVNGILYVAVGYFTFTKESSGS